MVQTIGLVNRTVNIKHTTEKCKKCGGSGLIPTGKVSALRIKGIKVVAAVAPVFIDIHEDCDCDAGQVPCVIKIIKKADRMKHSPIIINS